MSKKHFIALANSIKYFNQQSDTPFNEAQIYELMSFCRAQNPRFNGDRWLAYITGECGPNGGK